MPKRIVVINDDTTFLTLLRDLLTEEGYDTHLCKEGTTSYPRVRELDPDAIILDIRMEHPDEGWQMLEILKLDPVLTTKPIIICSADIPQLQERSAFLQSKGCQTLPKPFDLDDLMTLLERLVGGPA
ncbi:MAG: response regulator [Chloroflexota bacterium]|nr:response regulator [Chloroflexota bacterium]